MNNKVNTSCWRVVRWLFAKRVSGFSRLSSLIHSLKPCIKPVVSAAASKTRLPALSCHSLPFTLVFWGEGLVAVLEGLCPHENKRRTKRERRPCVCFSPPRLPPPFAKPSQSASIRPSWFGRDRAPPCLPILLHFLVHPVYLTSNAP